MRDPDDDDDDPDEPTPLEPTPLADDGGMYDDRGDPIALFMDRGTVPRWE